MQYLYNDEDNAPMSEELFELKKPADGCWNCMNFDWKREACTAGWNNLDESYYNPDTDGRELTDYCEYHELDKDADPAECFGGEES